MFDADEGIRSVITNLCAHFYNLGWASGTGGGIALRSRTDRVYVAPSGVQKEKIAPSDLFVLDMNQKVIENPTKSGEEEDGGVKLKPSACTPLFFKAFSLRNAGACLHSHSLDAMLVTMLCPGPEFRITEQEMIKGIKGHGYYDELVVPIIENTAHECDLADSLHEAIAKYPKTYAVLVRNHGVYIWGDNHVHAKTQSECYHYLFAAFIKMHQLGLANKQKAGPPVSKKDRTSTN